MTNTVSCVMVDAGFSYTEVTPANLGAEVQLLKANGITSARVHSYGTDYGVQHELLVHPLQESRALQILGK